jgi:hypothetical protein
MRFGLTCLFILALTMAAAGPARPEPESARPLIYFYFGPGQALLLGVVAKDGSFIAGEKAVPLVKGGEEYTLYSMTRKTGKTRGKKVEYQDEGINNYVIPVSPPAKVGGSVYGIAGDWNALPRVPKALGVTNKTYQAEVAKILTARGLQGFKVNLTGVHRVDLEGDGVDEVILSATTREAAKGMTDKRIVYYSFVALRKIVDGKVKTVLLEGDFTGPVDGNWGINRYRLGAVLDLNGDGVQEILVDYEYHEGGGVTAFEVKGGEVKAVAGCGYGA